MMPLVYQLMEQVLQAFTFWCDKFFLAKDSENLHFNVEVGYVEYRCKIRNLKSCDLLQAANDYSDCIFYFFI